MSINIGIDIGAISLKLAALGKPEDRAVFESLCAAKPGFRLMDWGAPGGRRLPLLLSDYRRIAGSPIQSTFDLLQEFYEEVPELRVEGIRVTGSALARKQLRLAQEQAILDRIERTTDAFARLCISTARSTPIPGPVCSSRLARPYTRVTCTARRLFCTDSSSRSAISRRRIPTDGTRRVMKGGLSMASGTFSSATDSRPTECSERARARR
jgi:hypothetical protein